MANVYRVVPSFPATVAKHQEIDQKLGNIEGELYDLGLISFEHGYPFIKSAGEESLNTFPRNCADPCKFFFLFPFDAAWTAFRSIEKSCFSHYEWEMLEYDMPDDILIQYCGYGFYSEKARVEFRMPESYFQGTVPKVIDNEELSNQLLKSYQKYVHQFGHNSDQFQDKFKEAISVAIEATRSYYESSFITKNRIVFSRDELFKHDENNEIIDILRNEELISVFQQKGINCSDDLLSIYDSLEMDSRDVYRRTEDSLLRLKKELKNTLPKTTKMKKI